MTTKSQIEAKEKEEITKLGGEIQTLPSGPIVLIPASVSRENADSIVEKAKKIGMKVEKKIS